MRKVLLSLLLTTAIAIPALAAPKDGDQHSQRIEDHSAVRQEAHTDRSQRHDEARSQAAAPARPVFQAGRPDFAPPSGYQPNFDRHQMSQPADSAALGNRHDFDGHNREQRPSSRPILNMQQSPSVSQQSGDSVTSWRQQQRDQMRQERREQTLPDEMQQERFGQQAGRYVRSAPPAYARPDRPAPMPQTAYNYDWRQSPQWHTDWRSDQRYDWRRYRDHHRSIFRIGIYYDPFGWGYQRFNIGWRLWPAYYDENYWLDDPYTYDLPYAPWPYKWVRYYDDALLVNVFTGQVVDTIYDFFW